MYKIFLHCPIYFFFPEARTHGFSMMGSSAWAHSHVVNALEYFSSGLPTLVVPCGFLGYLICIGWHQRLLGLLWLFCISLVKTVFWLVSQLILIQVWKYSDNWLCKDLDFFFVFTSWDGFWMKSFFPTWEFFVALKPRITCLFHNQWTPCLMALWNLHVMFLVNFAPDGHAVFSEKNGITSWASIIEIF